MRIACVGDNCIDRYGPPLGYALVGGNAVNVAVQLKRLGHDVAYFGAVGRDAAGTETARCLEAEGLNLDGLQWNETAPTAYTEIAVDAATGERHFVFEEFGATGLYRTPETEVAMLLGMDHVHIGWLADGGRLRKKLVEAGVSVSQDLSVNNAPEHLEPFGLTVAFAAGEQDRAMDAAENLLRQGARLAVVTSGGAGSLAFDGRTVAKAAALPIDPVDTTGAGDAFIAGFLDARLAGASLDASLGRGASLASKVCLYPGGFSQTPKFGF